MADSVTIYRTANATNVLLLDAAAGLTDGVWIDCADFTTGTFQLMLGGSTVELCGSNAFALPLNTNHGLPLAVAGAVNGWLSLTVLPRFVKARLTAYVAQASVGAQLRR